VASSPISLDRRWHGAIDHGTLDQWKEPLTGEVISSATLIVMAANDLLNHRDPDAWLTENAGTEHLRPA
jgi:hypothetical protein